MCTDHVSRATGSGWRISDLSSCFSTRPGRHCSGVPLRLRRLDRRKRTHRLADAPSVRHLGEERRRSGDHSRQRGDRRRHSGHRDRHLRRGLRQPDHFGRSARQHGHARCGRHREHQLHLQHRGRRAVRRRQRVHLWKLVLHGQDGAAERQQRRAARRRRHPASSLGWRRNPSSRRHASGGADQHRGDLVRALRARAQGVRHPGTRRDLLPRH